MAPLLAWGEASESKGSEQSQEGLPHDYISELLEEIQSFVFQRRIRIKDNFRDFDLARTSRCTKANFARALCSAVPFLKPFQVDALAEHFTERKLEVLWPRVVNYVSFCETVNDVFGPSKLEKCPMRKVLLPGERLRSAGGYFKAKSYPGDEERIGGIVNKVAVLCQTRGIEISSCLRTKTGIECPRGSGKVPSSVLLQRFPFMSQFSNEDMDILVRRYTDNHGTVHLHALEMDVLEVIQANRAEEISAGVYSDQDEDDEVNYAMEDSVSHASRSSRPVSSNVEDLRSRRSASSGVGRRVRPQTAPLRREPLVSISLDQVLAKIVSIMRKRSLRLPERFIDFDRLRKGVVAAGQMRSTLAILGLDLQRAELEVLEKAYSSVGPGDALTDARSFFRYRDFCKDVGRLEAAKNAQKDGGRRSSANSRLTRLVNIIKSKARMRRLELYDAFSERNRGSGVRGRVRRSTVLRVMHALGFPLTEMEVDTLCEGFSDEMGFNYYKFCSAVDPFMAPTPDKTEKAKKGGPPIQIPTTRYFDSSGRVVSHPAKLSRPSSAPQFRR